MNFPDIDTCRDIAAEFPESELVFVKSSLDVRTEDGGFGLGWCYRVRDRDHWKHEENDELICPAPTCEELGEYLHGKGFALMREWLGIGKWILYRNNCHFSFIDGELNETKARAESIKLILETKWNPSTSTT